MRYPSTTRVIFSASLLLASSRPAISQSRGTIHPSQTSAVPPSAVVAPAQQVPAAPPAPPPPAQAPPQRATVTFNDGNLTVVAANSSLNQILREISRLVGIKITGGVAEERVFGNYGPAQPSAVLAQLLDGTASNMMFLPAEGNSPAELVLNPRTGGVTPPNPNAARFDDANADEEARPLVTVPSPVPNQAASPPDNSPAPVQPTTASSPGNNNDASTTTAPATPPSDASQQQSPNGVKTPQQIYDELMRLRQQQQSKPQ